MMNANQITKRVKRSKKPYTFKPIHILKASNKRSWVFEKTIEKYTNVCGDTGMYNRWVGKGYKHSKFFKRCKTVKIRRDNKSVIKNNSDNCFVTDIPFYASDKFSPKKKKGWW